MNRIGAAAAAALFVCCLAQDDNFDTDKTRGFLGTALVGLVQSFTSRVFAGREFESEGEVLSLYSKSDRPKFTSTLGKMLVDIPSGKCDANDTARRWVGLGCGWAAGYVGMGP